MRTRTLSLVLFGTTTLAAAVVAACSSSSSDVAPTSGPDGGGQADTSTPPPASDGSPGQDAANDTSPPSGTVTFSYTPAWKGATKVEVLGAFGTATDWKQPIATLADDGSGTFTGTAAVPPGQFTYVFKVTGDEAAAKPGTYARFTIDPTNPAFVPCPAESPTFDKNAPNPCSQLTSPQPVAAPTYHFKGTVTAGGAPVAGYLVEIEREEPKSHHFFVNRMTTGADGAFDLVAATGSYRVQVLHPTYLAETDAQRTSPETLAALRRSISTPLLLAQDTTVNAAEVAYGGYAGMVPQGDAGTLALPATFAFTVLPGTAGARLSLYGPGASIGDPWYSGKLATTGSAEFDGGFNTNKAPDGGLVPDAQYWWGTEQEYPKVDGGVGWTAQTMVLPVRFQ